MKLECPKCGTKGQISDEKIPESGFNARCPRCKERFFIQKNQTERVAAVFPGPEAPLETSMSLELEEPVQPLAPVPMSATPQETCDMCKDIVSRQFMVRFGEKWVCAQCKPKYLQMLQQGLRSPGELRFAGFWIRFGAKVLDTIILYASGFLFGLLTGALLGLAGVSNKVTVTAASGGIGILIPIIYTTYFIGRYRATLGKMACGLVVVTSEGGSASYMTAFARYFGEIISSIVLCIGYIMAAFDEEKRSLHDRICNTRVVYK